MYGIQDCVFSAVYLKGDAQQHLLVRVRTQQLLVHDCVFAVVCPKGGAQWKMLICVQAQRLLVHV
jgi:hypothetical protein